MSWQHILVDEPRPRVRRITLNRPEKRNALNNRLRGEIFEALEQADRDPDGVDHDPARRRAVLLGRLRSVRRQSRRPALSLGRRAGPMVAPCGRRLVLDLGSRQARDRAGARLLPRRRHRARHRLRRRLRRRRCPDRLSAGAADEPAGHAISPLAGRHAPRHGIDADGRRDERPRGRRMGLCHARVSARRAGRAHARISPSAPPRCRSSCSSSTSARCIARWRSWAPAPPCAPAPKSRRWPSRRKRAATTCKASAAMVRA